MSESSETQNEKETQNEAQAQSQGMAILLPGSGVALFSQDSQTLEAARGLQEDWRFARVDLQIQEGDVDAAIAAYAEHESPDLVIIQTDVIDDAFTDKLGELAGHCDEGTAAIVIGPVNDVYLYRRMIDMGISDYLVRPLETPVMADVIARTLVERIGVTGSSLIAFVGAKGGVGTSVLTEAAACGVSEVLKQKTMLLDICGGWSTMSVGFGFEPSNTLREAMRAVVAQDEDSLNRMIHKATDKLSVLAIGGDAMLDVGVSPAELEDLIDLLMVTYPVVMIDVSQSSEALKKVVMMRAHQINVVTTQNLVSLRQARSLVQDIKDVRGDDDKDIELIVNMQGAEPKQEVSKADFEQAMGFEASSTVAYNAPLFQGSQAEGRPLIDDKDGMIVVQEKLLPVLQKTLAVDVDLSDGAKGKKSGFLGGLFKS